MDLNSGGMQYASGSKQAELILHVITEDSVNSPFQTPLSAPDQCMEISSGTWKTKREGISYELQLRTRWMSTEWAGCQISDGTDPDSILGYRGGFDSRQWSGARSSQSSEVLCVTTGMHVSAFQEHWSRWNDFPIHSIYLHGKEPFENRIETRGLLNKQNETKN